MPVSLQGVPVVYLDFDGVGLGAIATHGALLAALGEIGR